MLKKIISLLIICAMAMPFAASAQELSADAQKMPFADMAEGSDAYEAVSYLYEQGVINGKSETHFAPDDSLKREEFAKILVNAFDVAQAEAKTIFYDVPVGIWYAPFVSAISASGLMQGISKSEFGAGKDLTRQDLAVILKRFLDKEGVAFSGGSGVNYADNAEIAPYAKDAVEALCAQGIMDARENNLWKPTAYATRGETAVAVYNALNAKIDYFNKLGRNAPISQYLGPYDVPTDDRIAELTPIAFDAAKMPSTELVYEDFEDSDYGPLVPTGFGTDAVFEEGYGYESNGCIKVTKNSHARLRFKLEPGVLQPGDWIVFTAMVKGENISGSGGYCNLVALYDDNDKWVTEAGTRIKTSIDWTEQQQLLMVKADVNATTESEFYTVNLGAYMTNLTGTIYFDNFKLSKIVFQPMDTVLMTPNYKGIVKGDNGVGDIALRAYIGEQNGYYNLDELKIVSRIVDKEGNILLKSEFDKVTSVMDFYFSSKTLPMGGDFYLETILYYKDSGEELQKRDWPLHKREADFVTTIGYDEYDRITKNGVPVFPVGSYCGSPYELYVKDFSESGVVDFAMHYGMGWYYGWGTDMQTRQLIEKLTESGVDMVLCTGDMWVGGKTGEVNKRTSGYNDIRGLLTKIVNNYKDWPHLFTYYTYDEADPIRMGNELEWVNRIINELDLNHPTTCAMNRDYRTRPGVVSRTVDFIGYDPYPFTGRPTQTLSTVYNTIMTAKATNPNRPIYLIPQGFFYNTRTNAILGNDVRGPNLEEFRNMVFQGICAGASMICTYSYNAIRNTQSPGNTFEDEWKIHTTVYDELQYLEPIILSNLPAPYYAVKGGDGWLNTLAKRYDGKSYLFAVNNEGTGKTARIYLDGIDEIKGMYSKKTYKADDDGWFEITFDTYQVEIFEYEQADFKSSHAELKRFGLSDCATQNSEGDAYFTIPENMNEVEYKAAISDYAKFYINGNEMESSGKLDLADLTQITVKVVSEDERFTIEKTYELKRG